jgi:hypothetical protein
VTWLGLFIIGVKRPELHSDIRAKNRKPLIALEIPEEDGKTTFVAEHK